MVQGRRHGAIVAIILVLLPSLVTAFTAYPFRLSTSRISNRHGRLHETAGSPAVESRVSSSTMDTLSPTQKVQRVYDTWMWTYGPATYRINYRVERAARSGPTSTTRRHCILLVHGFGANVNHFRYQFPALVAAGYDVYALDLLGFGASDKPTNAATVGFSMELFIQQVTDFVQAQSADDSESTFKRTWTLAGNSIGGLVCLGVVAALNGATTPLARPIRVPTTPSFVVENIVLFNTSGGMSGFRYSDVPLWARPVLWLVQTVVLGPLVGPLFFQNFKTRDNVASILTQAGVYRDTTHVNADLMDILLAPSDDDGATAVFLAVFGGPAGPTAESLLPYVTLPVLALWGSDDPWTPLDAGAHPGTGLARHHATPSRFALEVILGAGHCPHDECPDVVNAKLLSFVQEQRERTNGVVGV